MDVRKENDQTVSGRQAELFEENPEISALDSLFSESLERSLGRIDRASSSSENKALEDENKLGKLKLVDEKASVVSPHPAFKDSPWAKNSPELEISDSAVVEEKMSPAKPFESEQNEFRRMRERFALPAVTDQPRVTKVVPDAVYIHDSHIEGGEGYRRKDDCSHEYQRYWLSRPTAEALMRAQRFLAGNGKEPVVLRPMNAAGRRARDRELIAECAPNQTHAKRHSTHEDGISIDVDNYDNPDVKKALNREGFVQNVKGDKPHFTRRR